MSDAQPLSTHLIPLSTMTKHDQMADKIANIDLNKEPANDHEKRLQDLKRFLLNADWLDDN